MTVATEASRAAAQAPPQPPLTRQPAFVRFWAGQSISVFGDQISALAIPLTAVLALDASALEVGILTALAWLPHLLFSLPAGVWIDRRSHRRENMIVADLLRALALVTIPVAWWLGALTIWQLLAVAFAVGAMTVFFDLSSVSFFVALVHRSQYVDANSKISTTRSLSYIAGPSTAGLLVQVFTAPVALLADALSFLVSAFALRGVRVNEPKVESNGTSARADLADGFRYLVRQPVIRAGVACTSIDQLLQLLHLRDLRPLCEPDARPERGGDRAHPRCCVVRRARRRRDRSAGRAEAGDRPRRRPRLSALSRADGAASRSPTAIPGSPDRCSSRASSSRASA